MKLVFNNFQIFESIEKKKKNSRNNICFQTSAPILFSKKNKIQNF